MELTKSCPPQFIFYLVQKNFFLKKPLYDDEQPFQLFIGIIWYFLFTYRQIKASQTILAKQAA